jgi:hypothetical protein
LRLLPEPFRHLTNIGCTVYAVDRSEVGVVLGLVGIAAVLAESPFLGLWLLTRKSALHQPS